MTDNHRKYTRVPPCLNVVLEARGEFFVAQTRDVCLKGAYVTSEQKFEASTICKMTIHLCGAQAGQEPAQIVACATVVRADEAGMALVFTEVVGLESFHHLQNLILYNAAYTENIEKELAQHQGLNRG
jgi:hypothetical protein